MSWAEAGSYLTFADGNGLRIERGAKQGDLCVWKDLESSFSVRAGLDRRGLAICSTIIRSSPVLEQHLS